MATAQSDAQPLRDELERVLSSACFARSERVSKLLRFLVERQLEGREQELKESLIGVEVFGRRPDYDPKLDSTVRTEAVRLRARLSKYYSTEGSQDPLVIELPKGGYVPRFRQAGTTSNVERARPRPPWLSVALAGLVVAAATTGTWWALHTPAPIPIAVLPLVNQSQDPGNDWFAGGLTDELITDLSSIDGLAVRSQTSSFALTGKQRNVREAGNLLGADYILEGSAARSGQRVVITAQLVRVRDDVTVWSRTFDRDETDVFAVQEEISRGIVNSLRLKLGRGRRRYETSIEAYDLYLHARALGNRRYVGLGDAEVIDLFEKAIAKDASMAPAWAGLAAAYAVQSAVSELDLRGRRADELIKMRTVAEKAIQLDPLLPEAQSALGIAYARNGQWDLAEGSFRRALEIAPNLAFAQGSFGWYCLLPLGRIEEALREFRAEARNDPLSPNVQYDLAEALLSAGRYDQALRQCEKIPADIDWRGECLGRAWLAQGRAAEAVRVLAPPPRNRWGYLAYAYAKAGRRSEAEKLIADATRQYPWMRGPWNYALAFAGLGDKDRAIEQLDRMAGVGPVRIGNTLNRPEFAFVRDDPRVRMLRKKVGLPE
jgi:TolB-like protein/Tfp pilus assembly protein PilF